METLALVVFVAIPLGIVAFLLRILLKKEKLEEELEEEFAEQIRRTLANDGGADIVERAILAFIGATLVIAIALVLPDVPDMIRGLDADTARIVVAIIFAALIYVVWRQRLRQW